ncbi:MAG: DUF4336 domain-containing protein [Cyanobacteria bacterium P01_A01_bin.17]
MELGLRPIPSDATSPLIEVAASIWTLEADSFVYYRPPAQPRYPYTHRAVVIRLEDGSLFIHSPIALTPAIRNDIDALGTVKYLVSPNHIHHLRLSDWSAAYPDAKLYASPGLPPKRKDLKFETTLSSDVPEPEWKGQIEQLNFKSWNGWLDEIVFFHCESRTVIFTDMIMDFDPEIFSGISRITTRWNQMYRHSPRGIQLVHSFGRESLRQALANVKAWEPEHLIVAHSPWQCVDGKVQVAEFLKTAFDWLEPQPKPIETVLGVARFSALTLLILPFHLLLVLAADIVYPRLVKAETDKSSLA